MKTWCLDFISTYEMYWNVPGDELDVRRAAQPGLRLAEQYAETAALAKDYNDNGIGPDAGDGRAL